MIILMWVRKMILLKRLLMRFLLGLDLVVEKTLPGFNDKAEYENSVFYLDIRKYFTPMKCPIQYKVHFLTTSEEVVFEGNTRSSTRRTLTTLLPRIFTGQLTKLKL